MNKDFVTSNGPKNEIIVYQPEGTSFHIETILENETVWLSQEQMAQLFQKDRTVIGRHIRNAIKEGEIDTLSRPEEKEVMVDVVVNCL